MCWWVVVRQEQTGVSIWDAVNFHSVNRWALSGAGVRAPWRGVLRDSGATLQRSSAGCMPAGERRLSAGVGHRHPVTVCKALFTAGSVTQVQVSTAAPDRSVVQSSTLLLNGPGLRWLCATLFLQQPSQSQQTASRVQTVVSTFCEVTRGVGGIWVSCPTLVRGMWARSKKAGFRCCGWLSDHF